jgi:hypothetical protein
MSLRLVSTATGEEVWSYSFDQRRRVQSREMVNTVQALSDIMQSQLNVVVGQLDALLLAKSAGGEPGFVPVSEPESPAESQTAPPAAEESGLDEGDFEIIRDR